MERNGAWGTSVSYPSLPPPPPGMHSSSFAHSPSLPGSIYPLPPPVPGLEPPSAPWVSPSPSASMAAPDDFADVDVVPYSGGGQEPYGARGTGSGSYWGESAPPPPGQMVSIQIPDMSSTGTSKGTKKIPPLLVEGAQAFVVDGVHTFLVQLLGDSGPKDVACKIGLDGVRIAEAESGRVMRIYPLDIITRWEVKEPTVFTFWVKTSVELEQRPVRLKSNAATTSLILDTLTAACIQVFEMVGKDKGEAGQDARKDGAGGASPPQPTSFMDWMLLRSRSAPGAPAPVVEKDHWVPDEEVAKCSSCCAEFGTFLRRHHCRNCGNVFCDRCSRGRTALTLDAGAPTVRVCDSCLAEVTQRLSFEKDKAEAGGGGDSGGGGSGAAASAIPSHEELMKRLESELKRSGSTSVAPTGAGELRKEVGGVAAVQGKGEAALPPALTGLPPAPVHNNPGHGSSSRSTRGPSSGSAAAAATWLSTCAFCTTVSLVSSTEPRCPTCGSPASPPPPAPAPAQPQAPSPQPYPPLPASAAPFSYPETQPQPLSAPHLWPSSASPGAGLQAPGAKREVVACPTCTTHLEVVLPATGTETMQCGVCQQPFLIGA